MGISKNNTGEKEIMEDTTRNIQYISFLRVIAVLSVITLHTNGCFWEYSTNQYWISANIIESFFYFGVPIFFMISGITLIDYQDRYSICVYLKKRTVKVVLPFIIWSVIGIVYRVQTGTIAVSSITIKNAANWILKTGIISHYWFFPSIICIYCCIPLFAAVPKAKRRTIFGYLIMVGFVFNILIPFIKTILSFDIHTPISVSVVGNSLFYVVVGVFLHENELTKKGKMTIYIVGIGGLLFHIIGTYSLSTNAGEIVDTYKGYNNLPCVLHSIAVFVFLKEIGRKIMKTKAGKWVQMMGDYAFPAFLMQWFILDIGRRTINFDETNLIYRLGAPLIVYGVIMVITFVLRKIPIIRKIVP